MRRALLLVLAALSACHDFQAEYGACVDAGRCAIEPTGGGAAGGGEPTGGGVTGGGSGGSGGAGGGLTGGGGGALDAGHFVGEVCVDGMCWDAPRPFGYELKAVVATSGDEAWAVGESGAVVHVVGSRLEGAFLGTEDLVAIATDGGTTLALAASGVWDVAIGRQLVTPAPAQSRLAFAPGLGFVAASGPTLSVLEGQDFVTHHTAAAPIFSIAGSRGALVLALAGNDAGRLEVQSDPLDVEAGWSSTDSPTFAPGPLAVDRAGRLWVGARDRVESIVASTLTDGGLWTTAFVDAGVVMGVAADDVAGLITLGNAVLRCSAPTLCTRSGTSDLALRATAVAEGTQWAVGTSGALFRVRDAGLENLSGASTAAVDALERFDGGWFAAVERTSSFGGELWTRTPSGWSRVLVEPTSRLKSLVGVGASLFVATDDGIRRVVGAALVPVPLREPDGGPSLPESITRIRRTADGVMAVGEQGGVYRLRPDGGWVREVAAVPGSAACAWDGVVDAGGRDCQLRDVAALPDGAFVAVGSLGSAGFVLARAGDGGVRSSETTSLRTGVTVLADGGVFVCGRDPEVLAGSPEALSQTSLDLPTGCNSVVSRGAGVLVAANGRIVSLDEQGTWTTSRSWSVPGGAYLFAVTIDEGIGWVGGSAGTIVRVDVP